MSVPTVYLTKADTAGKVMEAIQKAAVPDRFTHDFLGKQLGFTSSSDRPIIPMLKALRFIDGSNVPTDRYRSYKDPVESESVMAEAMRDTYADVFAVDPRADLWHAKKLQRLFGGVSGKGDAVAKKMASTFRAFAELGDFESVPGQDAREPTVEYTNVPIYKAANGSAAPENGQGGLSLRHDVHVHLPVSTDVAVYDAIFRSLREHLGP